MSCAGEGTSMFEDLTLYDQALSSWDASVLFGHGRGFKVKPPPEKQPELLGPAEAADQAAAASQTPNAPTPAPLWPTDPTLGGGNVAPTDHNELGAWDEVGSGYLRMRTHTICGAPQQNLAPGAHLHTAADCARLARQDGFHFFV